MSILKRPLLKRERRRMCVRKRKTEIILKQLVSLRPPRPILRNRQRTTRIARRLLNSTKTIYNTEDTQWKFIAI